MKKARLTEKQTLYTRCVPRAGRSLNQRRKAQINNRLRSQLDESSVAGQGMLAVHSDLAPNGDHRGLRVFLKIFDEYYDDSARQLTLAALLTKSRLRMVVHRNDLLHRRELAFTLSDG